MRIADLKDHLAGTDDRSIETTLSAIDIDPDATRIRLDTGEEFRFDEQAERSIAKYLGIPPAYMAKCPADLKAHTMNYWLQRRGTAAAVIEAVDDHWVTIHRPGLLILPLARVAEVVTTTLDPNYEIVNLIRNDTRFHLDVVTDHQVEVAPDDRIEDRKTRSVGDITSGGIRIVMNPTEVEAPQVQTFLNRLVCANGLTSPEAAGTIALKGRTVDDVIIEMEAACRRVMGELDDRLAEYASLATLHPPGSPLRFAYQLAKEVGLTRRVTDKIVERVNILPEDASLYDILQVFTEVAGSTNYKTMLKIQELAGEIAFNTEAVTHRCGTCTRLLPGE